MTKCSMNFRLKNEIPSVYTLIKCAAHACSHSTLMLAPAIKRRSRQQQHAQCYMICGTRFHLVWRLRMVWPVLSTCVRMGLFNLCVSPYFYVSVCCYWRY